MSVWIPTLTRIPSGERRGATTRERVCTHRPPRASAREHRPLPTNLSSPPLPPHSSSPLLPLIRSRLPRKPVLDTLSLSLLYYSLSASRLLSDLSLQQITPLSTILIVLLLSPSGYLLPQRIFPTRYSSLLSSSLGAFCRIYTFLGLALMVPTFLNIVG